MPALTTPDTLVPADISRAYLDGFSKAEQIEIETVYQTIKNRAWKDSALQNRPRLTAIFGSTGTGVTTLVKRLMTTTEARPVLCNAEQMMGALPGFQQAIQFSQHAYEEYNRPQIDQNKPAKEDKTNGMDAMRATLIEATRHFLPAGKYMQDRLMQEAIQEGRSVLVAKRGRTEGGIKLLEAVNRTGISLHTVIYQANLALKETGFENRYNLNHDIGLTKQEVRDQHAVSVTILPKLAAQSQSHLSLYFRLPSDGKRAEALVAHGDAGNYVVSDEKRAMLFDGYNLDTGITVENLMGERIRIKPAGMTPKVA